MSTVPIFAPDGSLGDIPQAQAQDALKAGGVLGVEMVSPDGKTGVVPLHAVGQARQAGAVLTGSRATPGVPQPNMQTSTLGTLYGLKSAMQNNLESNTQTVPGNSVSGMIQNVGSGASDVLAAPLLHPLDTAASIAKGIVNPQGAAADMVPSLADAYQKGGISGLLERLGGQVAGSAALGHLASGPPGAYESPVIPSEEVQATNLARAIKPTSPATYQNTIQNLTNQAGNIQEYAARTGNPLQEPLEFARAAKGAATEASQHYQQNILSPNSGDVVSVPPSYQGAKVGEGNRATLGSVDARLGTINDLLRPAYNTTDSGATMTALEKSGLESERNSLNDVLHNGLAQRTGLQPEDIQGLRQRSAQLFDIGNATEQAVRARQLKVSGYDEFGKPIPMTGGEMLNRFVQSFRGGPESIASKNFRNALGDVSIPATDMPQPNAPAPAAPAYQGGTGYGPSSPPSVFDYTPDQSAIAQQRSQLQARIAANLSKKTNQNLPFFRKSSTNPGANQ